MILIIIMIISSCWALLLQEFQPYRALLTYLKIGEVRKIISDYWLIDYLLFLIWKVCNCSLCMSAHIFWLTVLILTGSFIGVYLCPVVYFLTFWMNKKIVNVSI